MKYTLRQLQVFLAAAHSQNLTRAAEELAMSQSAASGALRELETHFDIKLFDRVGKRLQLNELGRLLQPRVEALLAQAGELELAFQQHAEAGPLKVGATLSIGNYLAVAIMARFMAAHPDARISLDVENTATIAEKVRNFELDIGLIEGEVHFQDLEVQPWREDELVVFCAAGHPLASAGRLGDDELLDADWILRESGSGTRQAFDRAMHGLMPRLKVLLELQHTEAIKRAVQAGLGIGCLSRVTLEDSFRRGDLVPLVVPGRDFRRLFYFVLHRQKYRSAGLERWIALCRES
ncbi:transcriptional regulator [Marinobacterium nitratireducens]|uniref:Transcriptional regulator n=1 Tax=Marinobacterium nitratireducens TaxID=518897 RepID=A0A917ZMI7_9GAMM|nr:LysR family transcriptional regulator [Marinobacterium nitratireducens]GGO87126.1 transcriptional regulator [Marinobacterium nitratireducens]